MARLCCALIALLQVATLSANTLVAGYTPEQAMQFGERMFRQGILPDGTKMQATLSGDIPVQGDLFSCINCHQRSGLGTVEGSLIVWPINGKELYVPRLRTGAWRDEVQEQGPGDRQRWKLPAEFHPAAVRPAYTDETLARLIRSGMDSGGKDVSKTMPKFQLSERDMAILVHYLKNLSSEKSFSPGVDQDTLRFATVITDEVPQVDRQAMLQVLQAHITAHNTQTRPHQRRAKRGPFYKTEAYGAYRKLELDIWELKGAPDNWREQLQAYYAKAPVFALLGGISTESWRPIHEFCEDYAIPSILPITDRPVVSESDWYTLYFSKGRYQEGETVASYLSASMSQQDKQDIIQVYRDGSALAGLAHGLQDTWQRLESGELKTIILSRDQPIDANDWQDMLGGRSDVTVLLWLEEAEVTSGLAEMSNLTDWQGKVFVPGSSLENGLAGISNNLLRRIYFTSPYSLPEESTAKLHVLKRWLSLRGIEETNITVQARMYFLGWMLPSALKRMRGEFYRDYFMEGFDMMGEQHYAIAVYPRLSFASGQRYLAKGSYIMQLQSGEQALPVKTVDWKVAAKQF